MKAPDDNDRLLEGSLPLDPEEDAEPMPDEVPPVSGTTLRPSLQLEAPTFAEAYAGAQLDIDEGRELVSLAHLPPWPDHVAPACGHGWGEHLDRMLGLGLRPGEMLAVGAASAGAGKTAWLMQIADGLALRNARVMAGEATWGPQLTPVLVASEMGVDALSWRSLARWTGHPSTYFRAGRTLARLQPSKAEPVRRAWQEARAALSGELGQARGWMRLVSPSRAGLAARSGAGVFVAHLRTLVETWREQIALACPGRAIVPLVIVDPLQRYQSGQEEVSDLNALARELCVATAEGGWITLLTSDTNKVSATGGGSEGRAATEEGAAAFRGSYNLMHEVTAAIYLRRAAAELTEDEEREGLRYIETVLVKNRWGASAPPWPRYRWYGPSLRFYPLTREQAEQASSREVRARRAPSEELARSPASGPASYPFLDRT